jgi:hypothetical protein
MKSNYYIEWNHISWVLNNAWNVNSLNVISFMRGCGNPEVHMAEHKFWSCMPWQSTDMTFWGKVRNFGPHPLRNPACVFRYSRPIQLNVSHIYFTALAVPRHYETQRPVGPATRTAGRRPRTKLQPHVLEILEAVFKTSRYKTRSERQQLAEETGVSEDKIRVSLFLIPDLYFV